MVCDLCPYGHGSIGHGLLQLLCVYMLQCFCCCVTSGVRAWFVTYAHMAMVALVMAICSCMCFC